MERPSSVPPAMEDAPSVRSSSLSSSRSPDLLAEGKSSLRSVAHRSGRIDQRDGALARSRIACRAVSEGSRAGFGSQT